MGNAFESHVAYFWCLPAICSTPNGVLGLKLLWAQMSPLIRDIRRYTAIRSQPPPRTVAAWWGDPIYFWLRRRDRIRQAVSFARALQTDKWASTEPGNGVLPAYRRDDIEKALGRVSAEDDAWAGFFERFRLEPSVIWYEDLAANTGAIIDEITSVLKLRPSRDWRSSLKGQSDALNDDWVSMFLAGCDDRSPRGGAAASQSSTPRTTPAADATSAGVTSRVEP